MNTLMPVRKTPKREKHKVLKPGSNCGRASALQSAPSHGAATRRRAGDRHPNPLLSRSPVRDATAPVTSSPLAEIHASNLT